MDTQQIKKFTRNWCILVGSVCLIAGIVIGIFIGKSGGFTNSKASPGLSYESGYTLEDTEITSLIYDNYWNYIPTAYINVGELGPDALLYKISDKVERNNLDVEKFYTNQPAKNFYGGRYNMEVLQEDRIMYRAGNAQNPYGRWFTSEPPASVTNVRIDAAVKTHWIDPKTGAYEASSYIDNVYAIKVPKGTTIYTGSVGPQGGVYVGGYNVMQTYIDAPWTFEVVGKTPLQ